MQTMPTTLPWPMTPVTPPLNRTNVAIGVAVSLLLHLLLAAWTWQHRMATHRFAETTNITVHLLPIAPVQPAAVMPHPEPLKAQHETAARTILSAKPRAVVTTPVPAPHEAPPTVPPSSTAPQPEKHLDMNAVYGSVKSAVAEVDRENAETPTGQLAAKPLYPPESGNKIGKMIDGTTRADCKDQVEGYGLFTPVAVLATLLDKKDSGCKWR